MRLLEYYERQHALLRTLEVCGFDFPDDDDEPIARL